MTTVTEHWLVDSQRPARKTLRILSLRCPLWVTSRPFARYYPNVCFRGQSSRSKDRFLEAESECLLFSIADAQIIQYWRN